MSVYMSQFSYTSESWAAQLKHPENRLEKIGRPLAEAAGGRMIGAWYCFGEYDAMFVADMPSEESMAALMLTITAGGAIKAGKTTLLMTGAQLVDALKKAGEVSKTYKPAR